MPSDCQAGHSPTCWVQQESQVSWLPGCPPLHPQDWQTSKSRASKTLFSAYPVPKGLYTPPRAERELWVPPGWALTLEQDSGKTEERPAVGYGASPQIPTTATPSHSQVCISQLKEYKDAGEIKGIFSLSQSRQSPAQDGST